MIYLQSSLHGKLKNALFLQSEVSKWILNMKKRQGKCLS